MLFSKISKNTYKTPPKPTRKRKTIHWEVKKPKITHKRYGIRTKIDESRYELSSETLVLSGSPNSPLGFTK